MTSASRSTLTPNVRLLARNESTRSTNAPKGARLIDPPDRVSRMLLSNGSPWDVSTVTPLAKGPARPVPPAAAAAFFSAAFSCAANETGFSHVVSLREGLQ